jgi:hypothetical protein
MVHVGDDDRRGDRDVQCYPLLTGLHSMGDGVHLSALEALDIDQHLIADLEPGRSRDHHRGLAVEVEWVDIALQSLGDYRIRQGAALDAELDEA